MKKKKNDIKERTLYQKIVNVFIGVFIVFLFLVFLFFSISQTSTFREYLRRTIVENVNESINGKISVGKIDGTLLTSLYLRDVIVTTKQDTLLASETIELKTSPLQLLFKIIRVRKLEIKNSKIELITDSKGESNLDELFISDSVVTENKSQPFPFRISASNVLLNNVEFYLHSSKYKNPNSVYDTLAVHDLHAKNINASIDANIDLKNQIYDLSINKFSCESNIRAINIKNINSHITLDNKRLIIEKLYVETTESRIDLVGSLNNHKLFDSNKNNPIKFSDVVLNINSERLNLNEIGKFIPSILPFDGIVSIELKSKGKFNNLYVNLLKINVGKSLLNITGNIKNLDHTDSLKIDADINESILYASEISKKLKFINLPEFTNLKELKIDSLSFVGNGNAFNTRFKILNDKGMIVGSLQMNFMNKDISYSCVINTKDISLLPIINVPVKLNSKININGSGTNLLSMNSKVNVIGDNSFYGGNKINKFLVNTEVKEGRVNYQIDANIDSSAISAKGTILSDKNNKFNINLNTNIRKFNTMFLNRDTSLVTKLNFDLTADATIELNGTYSIKSDLLLKDSYLNKTLLNSNDFKININGNNEYVNNLNIKSEQLDADFKGKFSADNIIYILSEEISSINNVIDKEINKLTFTEDSLNILTDKANLGDNTKGSILKNESLNYSIEFKQFNMKSPFTEDDNYTLTGTIYGNVVNNNDSVNISLNSNLDYVKVWGDVGVYFLSDLSLNINLLNKLNFTNLSNLEANIVLNTKRIFTGSDIKNIRLDYSLKAGQGNLKFNSDVRDNFNINIIAQTDFDALKSTLKFERLRINFNRYVVKNNGLINISYSKGKINFDNFLLSLGESNFKIDGSLSSNEDHNLLITLDDISIQDIATKISRIDELKNYNGQVNLFASIEGNYFEPKIVLSMKINNLSKDKYNLGLLDAKVNYSNQKLTLDLSITDTLDLKLNNQLKVSGVLPIDLGLDKIDNRLLENEITNFNFSTNNFPLLAVSNFIPKFSKLNGVINSDLKFSGKINNLLPTGFVNIENVSFILDFNNLGYNASFKITADNGNITLDNLYIANTSGTRNGGELTGNGFTILKNYDIISPKIYLNGELKILSDASRSVSPLIYGDLVVATESKAEFIMDFDNINLKAPLLVKSANLTFSQAKPSYKNTRDNFIYKYITDTLNVDKDITSFDNLIKLSLLKNSSLTKNNLSSSNIFFDVDIKVEDEATIKFILDKEFNQILNANISGDFQYKTIEGIPRAFGTLTLREGSSLEFLTKTFEAGGSLRFENELANPNLDVVGIYRNYYYEPTTDSTNVSSQEKEVAVKVKLTGPLQDLNKNFINNKNNLAVYYGTENIDKDIPDPTKDASDAIMFIVTGRFTNTEEGYTNVNQNNTLTGTASSIASSLIGGLLNSYAGDYIRSVELKQMGTYTKFSLSGKVNKFKYSIGGTTEVFQDLGRTNIRIEYPFFQKFFIRLERKESLTESNLLREMINELGLKYKFEF